MTSQQTLTTPRPDQLLRTALLSNGTFSAFSGAVMTVFAESVAEDALGIDAAWAVRLVGIGLLLFAASLFFDATRPTLNAAKAMLTVVQDAAWVLGSIILIVFNPFDFSSGGLVWVGVIAAIVAVFAAVQEVGIHRLKNTQ